jgi:glycerol-3-phosphate acyltransferase PlsY
MNLFLWSLIIILSGYIIGCLHGSIVAKWISGVNVKEQGIKNSGASNATIVLGWKYGALVALIDIGKGIFSVLLLSYLITSNDFFLEHHLSLLFLISAAVILGHNYPLLMKFDGGKGTASLIGIMFALNWQMGLIGLLLFIFTSLITDYLLYGVLVLYLIFCGYAIWFTEGLWSSVIAIALFALAFWKHRENVRRLNNGLEPRISSVIKRKKAISSSN